MVLEVIQLRYSDREAASCRTALIEAAIKLEVEFQLLVLIGGLDVLGRRTKVFGKQNPVARLRSLIEESLLVDGASKETFYAE